MVGAKHTNDNIFGMQIDNHLSALERNCSTESSFQDDEGLFELVGELHWAKRLLDSTGIPKKIGKFDVTKKIGTGGQSTTYLAFDPDLQRKVVLKLYHGLENRESQEKMIDEGRILARIDSPYVVKCLGVNSSEVFRSNLVVDQSKGLQSVEVSFLVLEYVSGKSLDQHLRLNRFSYQECQTIIRKLAIGVQAVHKAGVIHRDIKPSNIIIDANGDPKLIDFGLAFAEEDRIFGECSGTVEYLSPEQADGKSKLTKQTDVFGLGAVLYELTTGFPPYRSESREKSLESAKDYKLDDPRSLNPSIPAHLVKVCRICMHKDPGKRFNSSIDIANKLSNSSMKKVVVLTILLMVLVLATVWFGRSQPSAPPAGLGLNINVKRGIRSEEILKWGFALSDNPIFEISLKRSG